VGTMIGAMARRALQGAQSALERAQRASPVGTSALTGFSVMAVGDGMVQVGTKSEGVDPQRLLVGSLYNGCVYSPLMFVWWGRLDRVWPGRTLGAVARKVIANQFVVTPINSLAFISWTSTLGAAVGALRTGGEVDWAEVRTRTQKQLRTELPELLAYSCCFWPVAHSLNFAFVPLPLRIVFMSACSVGWGGYLSFCANRDRTRAS